MDEINLDSLKMQKECLTKEQIEDRIKNGDSELNDIYSNDNLSVPNMDNLTEDLIKVISYLCTDEMVELGSTDKKQFNEHVRAHFPEVSQKYYGLLETLLDYSSDDITPLLTMLSMFKSTTNDELTTDFENYKEEMAKRFIYPQYGGKEGYELAILRDQMKNKRAEMKKNKKARRGRR